MSHQILLNEETVVDHRFKHKTKGYIIKDSVTFGIAVDTPEESEEVGMSCTGLQLKEFLTMTKTNAEDYILAD